MARGRFISKSLSTSRKFATLYDTAGDLAEFCGMLYMLLVAHTDDFGRLDGDPWTVKHAILPASPRTIAEITKALACLVRVGLVEWYEGGKPIRKVLAINDFDNHQFGLHKRTKSLFPASGKFPELPGNSVIREEKGREGKRRDPDQNEDPAIVRSDPHAVSALALFEKTSGRPPEGGKKRETHRGHAWCCDRGLCVPHAMHEELAGRLGNGEDVGLKLVAFYEKTIGGLNGQAVGDTVWQFWRNSFSAEFGTVTREPSATRALGKGERSVMAMQKVMERRRLKP